jgi:hypothetical protein
MPGFYGDVLPVTGRKDFAAILFWRWICLEYSSKRLWPLGERPVPANAPL